MKRLGIIGLGLMGGSLGLAVKARAGGGTIVAGYARGVATRREALARGAVDEAYDTPGGAVAGADVVVLCVPVLAIGDVLGGCRPYLAEGAVVTDVGSTKASVVHEAERILEGGGAAFVGSHPMAGSDRAGIGAAQHDLYEGATVVVTPTERSRESDLRRVAALWRLVGGCVETMRPAEHDRIVARTSHLPHVVAAALVRTVQRGEEDLARFRGPGYRDTTRIAAGSEALWHDIVKTNCCWLREELEAFIREAGEALAMLDAGDFEGLRGFFAQARKLKER